MKASELIAQFRWDSGDDTTTYLTSDAQVVYLVNEAVDQGCLRKPLILDSTTAAVCEFAVVADTATYALHEKIVKVNKAYLVDSAVVHVPLTVVDRFEMDRLNPAWREEGAAEPKYLVVDEKTALLVPTPNAAYTGKLEVQRQPLDAEKLSVPAGAVDPVPAIATAHHEHLVHWVLSRVYMVDDADQYAPGKAQKHEAMFNRYFGLPPTSDRLRSGMANRPHRNKLW